MSKRLQIALHLTQKQKRRAERTAKARGLSRDAYIAALLDADYENIEKLETLAVQRQGFTLPPLEVAHDPRDQSDNHQEES